MDSLFSMDQYYSDSSCDLSLQADEFAQPYNSIEQASTSSPSSSPIIKQASSESAPSNDGSSPRETQWQPKRPRKRSDKIHRPYRCGWDGCDKAYGRLNHLNTHVAIHRHGPRRTGMDFPHTSRKKSIRPILPDLQSDYQLVPVDSSSSDASPTELPSAEEPFIFSNGSEWYPLFQESEEVMPQMSVDRYSLLAVQKSRLEHGRNEALTRVKTLEHERNTLASELSRLEQKLFCERQIFTQEQQALEQTMDQLSQWRYPQQTEVSWGAEN